MALCLFCCLAPSPPPPQLPNSWNKVIKKHLSDGNAEEAIRTYLRMQQFSIPADNFTYPVLLKAISSSPSFRRLGLALHAQITKSRFSCHPFVLTSLLNMYSSFREIGEARKVFDGVWEKDVVAWNSMLDGYVSSGRMELASQLFDVMPERDLLSFNIMLSGYASVGNTEFARVIFDEIPERDVVSWNVMILACGNAGDLDEARRLFEEMPDRNVVSWNTLLTVYLSSGSYNEVIDLFERMKAEKFRADYLTITTVLSASANLGLLDKGRELHVYAQELGIATSPHVASSLIDMYAKCGCIGSSLSVFYKSKLKDVYCWNAVISGLALHGYGFAASKVFNEMLHRDIKPDDITFIGLLSACSHAGLVEEGQVLFESMEGDYGVRPKLEHYGCMVDLMSRAGFIENAYQIMESMPFRPGKSVLGALLSACVNHGDLVIGEKVMQVLLENHGYQLTDGDYMLISNLYASCNRWDEASRWREKMEEQGIAKVAGCSIIEVDGKVFSFLAGIRTTDR